MLVYKFVNFYNNYRKSHIKNDIDSVNFLY